MGEIADMHLDGTLCESCGVFLGDPVGYPRRCAECGSDPAWTGRTVGVDGEVVTRDTFEEVKQPDPPASQSPGRRTPKHIEGALAELLLAQHLGSGIGITPFREPRVRPEPRGSTSRSWRGAKKKKRKASTTSRRKNRRAH